MDTCKEHEKSYIFIYAKKRKKKKRKSREKSVKEVIFWEGIFISCLSKMFYPKYLIFILFSFLHHKNFIYLNKVFHYYHLFCSPSLGSYAERSSVSCDLVLPYTLHISDCLKILILLCNLNLTFLYTEVTEETKCPSH